MSAKLTELSTHTCLTLRRLELNLMLSFHLLQASGEHMKNYSGNFAVRLNFHSVPSG